MRTSRMIQRLAALLLFLTVQGWAGGEKLLILHTNDIHASFAPHEAAWIRTSPKPMVGGFVRLQQAIDSIRGTGASTLLLDAGDIMTGTPISDIEYHGAEGGALIDMMNRLGYEAWCPGNHDFDISQGNLKLLARNASFPTLCANLVDGAGKFPLGNKPYLILKKDGHSIGIIGLMSQALYDLVNQQNLTGLRVLSPSETAKRYIAELRRKVDLLVLLTHQGADEDSTLAEAVSGVDVIVGGHSHTRLKSPKIVHGVEIVQAGSNCENLGVLEIAFDAGKPVRYAGRLIQLWPDSTKKPGSVEPLVRSMQERIQREFSQVIGRLSEDWRRQDEGNPLATFVTEAQRKAAFADVAFTNVHGVRKDLSAGPVTKRDLYEVLPFRNMIVTFQLSGAQLQEILHYYIAKRPAVIMTGLSARWKTLADGTVELVGTEVGGKPLSEKKMYTCAASDYFVGEASRYLGLEIPKASFSNTTVFSAVEQQIRREGSLKRAAGLKLERVQ